METDTFVSLPSEIVIAYCLLHAAAGVHGHALPAGEQRAAPAPSITASSVIAHNGHGNLWTRHHLHTGRKYNLSLSGCLG